MHPDPAVASSLRRSQHKPVLSRRPLTKWLLGVVVTILVVLGWFSVTAFASVFRIIDTPSDSAAPQLRFGGAIDPNALEGEGDGRINILILGVGGSGHKGGSLADTIMVASIDPDGKKLGLLSIPRDLRVPIAGNGVGKINSAHSYGEQQEKGGGPKVMKATVSTVLDLPIHYYVRVDFQGFTQFVDKLGGLSVNVAKPINDPFYPDAKTEGYEPFSLKAGVQNLNGKTALKFARSRETTSDFDRAGRQQQLLLATKEKLLSLNVLSNPKKLTDLMGILGDHVRTDLSVSELERLVKLTKDIDQASIVTEVFDNSANGPLMTVSDGGYYLAPRRGDFREVQRIAHELFTDPYLAKEAATVALVNATGKAVESKEIELDLKSLGYKVVATTDAEVVATTTLADFSKGKKPFTVQFLEQRFGASSVNATGVAPSSADLVLTVGSEYLKTKQTTKR